MQVAHGDIGEPGQVQLFAEQGEENVAVVPKQAGRQAQLARLLRRHKIAAHVVGRGDGLALGEALVEPVQQRAIGERHVGEAKKFLRKLIINNFGYHKKPLCYTL